MEYITRNDHKNVQDNLYQYLLLGQWLTHSALSTPTALVLKQTKASSVESGTNTAEHGYAILKTRVKHFYYKQHWIRLMRLACKQVCNSLSGKLSIQMVYRSLTQTDQSFFATARWEIYINWPYKWCTDYWIRLLYTSLQQPDEREIDQTNGVQTTDYKILQST